MTPQTPSTAQTQNAFAWIFILILSVIGVVNLFVGVASQSFWFFLPAFAGFFLEVQYRLIRQGVFEAHMMISMYNDALANEKYDPKETVVTNASTPEQEVE